MKRRFCILVVAVASTLRALCPSTLEVEQIKSELSGRTVGGREKSWKFRSPEHIKQLDIVQKSETPQRRVCTIKLLLEADKACGRYAAEVRLEYAHSGGGWKLEQAGLLSLAKVMSEPASR